MKRSKFSLLYIILKFFILFVFFVYLKTRHDLIKYDHTLTQNNFKRSQSSKLNQFYQILSISFINNGPNNANGEGAKDISDNKSVTSSISGNPSPKNEFDSDNGKQGKTHSMKICRSSSCPNLGPISSSRSNSSSNYDPNFKIKSRSKSEPWSRSKRSSSSKTRSRSKTRSKSKTRSRSESRSRSIRLMKKQSKSDSSMNRKPSTSKLAPLNLEDRIGSIGSLSSKEELGIYCLELSVQEIFQILQSKDISQLNDASSFSLSMALDELISMNSSLVNKLIDLEKPIQNEKSKLNPGDKNYERRLSTLKDFIQAESSGIIKRSEQLFKLVQILFQILYSRKIQAFESTTDAIISQNPDPKVITSRRIVFSSELISNLSVLYNMLHCSQSSFSSLFFCRFLQDYIENNKRVNKALTKYMMSLEESNGVVESSSKVNRGRKSRRKTRTKKKGKQSKTPLKDPEREDQEKKIRKLNSKFRKLFTSSNIGLESIE